MSEKKIPTKTLLNGLLHEYGGDKKMAAACLKRSRGYEWINLEWLEETIEKDPALAYVWKPPDEEIKALDIDGVKATLESTPLTALNEEDKARVVRKRQERFKTANVLLGLKLPPEAIESYLRCQELAGEHFGSTLDASHGLTVELMFSIQQRMQKIIERHLDNENEVVLLNDEGMPVIDENGAALLQPEVSQENKIGWQREFTALADVLRKIKADIDRSAEIRAKALQGNGKEPQRKLRPAF